MCFGNGLMCCRKMRAIYSRMSCAKISRRSVEVVRTSMILKIAIRFRFAVGQTTIVRSYMEYMDMMDE